MAKSSSRSDEDTAITRKNRHQFYETAVANIASDADCEIRMAESRGRERVLREVELRRRVKRSVALLVVCVGVLIWLLVRGS